MENNIFKKIKKSISATILCLRFPFLYPRNRFTDKHYNNWWIQKQIKRCQDQYMQVMSVNICTQAYIDHIKENKSEPDTNTYGTGFSKTRKQSISKIFNINNTEVRVSKDDKNIKFHIYGNTPNSIQSIPLEKYLHSDTYDKSELYNGNITDVYLMQTTTITNTFVGTNTSQGYSVLLVSDKSNEVDTQYKGFIEVIMDPLQKYIISVYNFIENVLGIFHCIPTYTELGAMPVGWRKAFGIQICKDIRHALIYTVIDKENITWKTPGKFIKAYIKGFKYLFNYRITQIKEKFGCYDEQTEVLTKNGWKFFKDVTYNDSIATLNPRTNELEYQIPTDIISAPYTGPMYKLVNRGIDLLVTPNHNLYVAKGSYFNGSKNNEKRMYDMELTTPDTYFLKDKRFKKTCIWSSGIIPSNTYKIPDYSYTNIMDKKGHLRTYTINGPEIEIHAFLRFLGFYIAEGYTSFKTGSGSTICLAHNPYTEKDLAYSLISDMGFTPHNLKCTGIHSFSNAPLAIWLKEHCGHLALHKKVPDFIKNLPTEYIEEFLYYLYLGDGHFAKTACVYTTISKQLADDICELLLKCNSTFRLYTRLPRGHRYNGKAIHGNYITYNINWLKLPDIEIDISKAKHIKSFCEKYEVYIGNVYCVTVPNHIIYVRRNGKGVWCGNSLRWYDERSTEVVHNIIDKYESISYNTCIHCGKSAEYMTTGWISPYCADCLSEDEKQTAKKLNKQNGTEKLDNLVSE